MKKIIASLLTLTLLTPALAFAHPGDWGPGWGRHGGPDPLDRSRASLGRTWTDSLSA